MYTLASSKENDPHFIKKDHPFKGYMNDFLTNFGGDNFYNEVHNKIWMKNSL